MATHQGQDKRINFGGIVRNTAESTCPDGEFDEIINLHWQDGHFVPIRNFEVVSGFENKAINYEYIFVHKNNYQHLLGYAEGALWYFGDIEGEQATVFDEPVRLCDIHLTEEIGIQYAQTGNLLTIVNGDFLKYIFWRYDENENSKRYVVIDNNYNGEENSRTLLPEGKIDFRLAPKIFEDDFEAQEYMKDDSSGERVFEGEKRTKMARIVHSKDAFFTQDASNDELKEKALTLIKQSRNISNRKCEPTGFFFICTAIRTYDGSHILMSRPVLINPPQDYESRLGKISGTHDFNAQLWYKSGVKSEDSEGNYHTFHFRDSDYDAHYWEITYDNVGKYVNGEERKIIYSPFYDVFFRNEGVTRTFNYLDRNPITQRYPAKISNSSPATLLEPFYNYSAYGSTFVGAENIHDLHCFVPIQTEPNSTSTVSAVSYDSRNEVYKKSEYSIKNTESIGNIYNHEVGDYKNIRWDENENCFKWSFFSHIGAGGMIVGSCYDDGNVIEYDFSGKKLTARGINEQKENEPTNPVYKLSYNGMETVVKSKNDIHCVNSPTKIQFRIETNNNFRNYIGAFSHVDVFMTHQVDPFYYNKKEDLLCQEMIVDVLHPDKDITGRWFAEKTKTIGKNIYPKRLENYRIIEELEKKSDFFLIHSIKLNDFSNDNFKGKWVDIDFKELKEKGGFNHLQDCQKLEAEASDRSSYSPNASIMYNGRLHIANYEQKFFKGFPIDYFYSTNYTMDGEGINEHGQFVSEQDKQGGYLLSDNGHHWAEHDKPYVKIETDIETEDGIRRVVRTMTDENQYFFSLNPMLSYPDTRAKKMKIVVQRVSYGNDGKHYVEKFAGVYELKPHSKLPFAYFIKPDITPIRLVGGDYDLRMIDKDETGYMSNITQEDNPDYIQTFLESPERANDTIEKINYLKVSSVDNPMFFPFENTYVVGNEGIIAMANNNVALSEGQAGDTPLFVFAKDGIYGLFVDSTGEVAYTNSRPISRFVCNDWRTITYTDIGIAFATDIGLMLLIGSDCKDISDVVEGGFFDFTNAEYEGYLPVADRALSTNGLVQLKDKVTKKSFIDFIRSGCIVGYNYYNRELWVTSTNTDSDNYSYIFSNGIWVKSTVTCSEYINNYPDTYMLRDGKLYILGKDKSEDDRQDTMFLTRPIKFNTQEFKQAYRAILRGRFQLKSTPFVKDIVESFDENWRENATHKEYTEVPDVQITCQPFDKSGARVLTMRNEHIDGSIVVYDNYQPVYVDIPATEGYLTIKNKQFVTVRHTEGNVTHYYNIRFTQLMADLEEDFDPAETYNETGYKGENIQIWSSVLLQRISENRYETFCATSVPLGTVTLEHLNNYELIKRTLDSEQYQESEYEYYGTLLSQMDYTDERLLLFKYHASNNTHTFTEEEGEGRLEDLPIGEIDHDQHITDIEITTNVTIQDLLDFHESGEMQGDHFRQITANICETALPNDLVKGALIRLEVENLRSYEFILSNLYAISYGDMLSYCVQNIYTELPATALAGDKFVFEPHTNYHITDLDGREFHFYQENGREITYKEFVNTAYSFSEAPHTLQSETTDFAKGYYRIVVHLQSGTTIDYYTHIDRVTTGVYWSDLSVLPSSGGQFPELTEGYVRDNTTYSLTNGAMHCYIYTQSGEKRRVFFRFDKLRKAGKGEKPTSISYLTNAQLRSVLADAPYEVEVNGEFVIDITPTSWSSSINLGKTPLYRFSYSVERDTIADHAGIYLFGSYDSRNWAFIGGNELIGSFRDLGCVSHRLDCKYFRMLFVGRLCYDSYIDYVEMSVISNLLGNRLR